MNEFSPKAETNDMEQPRTMERSLRSLFLHLGAMPSSDRGKDSAKPFKFTRDILPFLARFVNLDEGVIGGKYPRLYFP